MFPLSPESRFRLEDDGELVPTKTLEDALDILSDTDFDSPDLDPAWAELRKASQEFLKTRRGGEVLNLRTFACVLFLLASVSTVAFPQMSELLARNADSANWSILVLIVLAFLTGPQEPSVYEKTEKAKLEKATENLEIAARYLKLHHTRDFTTASLAESLDKIEKRNRKRFKAERAIAKELRKKKQQTEDVQQEHTRITQAEADYASKIARLQAENGTPLEEAVQPISLDSLPGISFEESDSSS